MSKKMPYRYVVGIDEAGRGPIAGPVALGAVMMSYEMWRRRFTYFRGVKDSKQLTAAGRERWFERLKEESEKKNLFWQVSFGSSYMIDARGISYCIKTAIKRSLGNLKAVPDDCLILLDGSLKAPAEFPYQETIIKGDEKEPIIALASIAAKVSRDRLMGKMAAKYPDYGFEQHKGYGTKAHYEALSRLDLCEIHRRTYIKLGDFAAKQL